MRCLERDEEEVSKNFQEICKDIKEVQEEIEVETV
jgi:hypothetical protein